MRVYWYVWTMIEVIAFGMHFNNVNNKYIGTALA